MDWKSIVGLIADIAGILGAIFALFAWIQTRQLRKEIEKEKQRMNKKVTVTLSLGQQKIEVPVDLRRAELTRAEVLGRLGMIPRKGEKGQFSLRYLNTPDFFKQINQIIDGTGDSVLTISCTPEEFEQFDISHS